MILTYNTKTEIIEKMSTKMLGDFNIDELKLQGLLFKSLGRLFPDDELLMIMKSRAFREEPDLMALDKNGKLYIFELKATESHPENILQVLRYAQMYGSYDLDDIDKLYQKFSRTNNNICVDFKNKFNVELNAGNCNKCQILVVITNGIDYKTREAIKYWRSCKLDVRPWIYRVYGDDNKIMNLEISPFRVEDNPYEDITGKYYILNTNYGNSDVDHDDMLMNKKCAAYYEPWKYTIERLNKGDIVFLYQSSVGIVAFGEADGKVNKCDYHNNPEIKDEEYNMNLLNFNIVKEPLGAWEIKNITEVNYVFMRVMFAIDNENGKKIYNELLKRL